MKNKAFFKYLFALLLFGSNGIVAGFIELGSLQIVLLRTLIGSFLLIALFFLCGGKLSFYKHLKQFAFLALSGIAMGASWMFLYEAYDRIGVSISSLLYYCGPVIVIILSPLLFKERLTFSKLFGFIFVIVGVFLINGTGFSGNGDTFGIICGLLSALMYAFMVICNKKAPHIVGLENATLQLVTAFLTVAAFIGLKQGYAIRIPATSILPILILGLLNTGIGCYFYFSSIGKLQVQTVAICGYLEPLSAVVFATLLLNEKMSIPQIAGAICIIGGAMISELVKKS